MQSKNLLKILILAVIGVYASTAPSQPSTTPAKGDGDSGSTTPAASGDSGSGNAKPKDGDASGDDKDKKWYKKTSGIVMIIAGIIAVIIIVSLAIYFTANK